MIRHPLVIGSGVALFVAVALWRHDIGRAPLAPPAPAWMSTAASDVGKPGSGFLRTRDSGSGRAVAGARVHFMRIDGRPLEHLEEWDAVLATDSGGECAFPGGPHLVHVRAPGYAPCSLSTEPGQRAIEVRLHRLGTIRGTVKGESGRPIGGASVRLRLPSPLFDGRSNLPDEFLARHPRLAVEGNSQFTTRLAQDGGLAPHENPGRRVVEASTDAEGSFEFPDLPAAGDYSVLVRQEGFTLKSADAVALSPGSVTVVNCVLSQGLSLTGRLRRTDGAPASGARVHVMSTDPKGDMGTEAAALTDSEGRFRLAHLRPGLKSLDFKWTSGSSVEYEHVNHVLAEGPGTDLGDIVVGSAGRQRGLVLSPDGAPVADALVWILVRVGGDVRNTETCTDPAGGFDIRGLADGEITVVVTPPEGSPSWAPIRRKLPCAADFLTLSFARRPGH